MSGYLRLERLTKRYGDTLAADAITLAVDRGEMIVLLGPSGCGKTTTLRMIAGFEAAGSGEIVLEGRAIAALPPHRRQMGMVFQNYALFPHLTVARNVAFGLEMRRMAAAERAQRVNETLRLVKLDSFANRLPRQLSGGQQQRVAIARALAIHPKVLLLDEPLSNLDAELRQDVAREIRLLQQARGLTTIMVTHDQQEAMAMADRLVVMRNGRVQQVGQQQDLYQRPANPFVARFIGNSNLLTGDLADGARFRVSGSPVPEGSMLGDSVLAAPVPGSQVIGLAGTYLTDGTVTVAVRPERITLSAPREAAQAHGEVLLSSYMGAIVEHVVAINPQTHVIARAPSSGIGGTARFPAGTRVALSWPQSSECVFDAADRPIAAGAAASNERIATDA